jgi:myo-inositol-hexaphosphate 3-phosphohydrolase
MAGIVEDRVAPRRDQQVSGMAVDPDGNVYITDATRGIIERITLAGNRTTLVSRLKNPSSLVIDSGNGAIYYIDGGILYVVNPVVAGK